MSKTVCRASSSLLPSIPSIATGVMDSATSDEPTALCCIEYIGRRSCTQHLSIVNERPHCKNATTGNHNAMQPPVEHCESSLRVGYDDVSVQELPEKKRGHSIFIGEELEMQVRANINAL